MHPEERLERAGLVLPAPLPPTANYRPFRRAGQVLYLSGHGPRQPDGNYLCGRLRDLQDISRGYEAAQLTALNLLATLKLAVHDLTQVECVLKVLGMVNAEPDFTHHPKVINGFSDVLITAFGEDGQHARSAVGMGSLPHGMLVEVEAVILLRN
jgi:enamine deaminase RidA (YjgF/YER057c/UK114 family)